MKTWQTNKKYSLESDEYSIVITKNINRKIPIIERILWMMVTVALLVPIVVFFVGKTENSVYNIIITILAGALLICLLIIDAFAVYSQMRFFLLINQYGVKVMTSKETNILSWNDIQSYGLVNEVFCPGYSLYGATFVYFSTCKYDVKTLKKLLPLRTNKSEYEISLISLDFSNSEEAEFVNSKISEFIKRHSLLEKIKSI